MAHDRSPAFQNYPKDWRDVKVRRMSLAAQGAYRAILDDMWVDSKDQCSILDCDPFIAKSLGVTVDEWLRLREEIQHEIEPLLLQKSGRLYSKRLKAEALKQRNYRQLQSEKGKKSAEKRFNHGSTAVQPEHQPEGNSSSSSSSSSSQKIQKKRKSDTHAMPETWDLTAEMVTYGAGKGMTPATIPHEFDHCKGHHVKVGSQFTQRGWEGQVWRTWVLGWVARGRKQILSMEPSMPKSFRKIETVKTEHAPIPENFRDLITQANKGRA